MWLSSVLSLSNEELLRKCISAAEDTLLLMMGRLPARVALASGFCLCRDLRLLYNITNDYTMYKVCTGCPKSHGKLQYILNGWTYQYYTTKPIVIFSWVPQVSQGFTPFSKGRLRKTFILSVNSYCLTHHWKDLLTRIVTTLRNVSLTSLVKM